MQTMGLDNEFTVVLRELVQFLEALVDVKLPELLLSARENLLTKCKAKLAEPEAYLDMTANKGLLISTENLDEVEEYVKHEPAQIDYYETFQDLSSLPQELKIEKPKDINSTEDEHLIDIYSHFTIAQTRSQCKKSGILHVKKKVLFLGPLKSCFVGLIGAHLLIYGSDKDSKPSYVISLRGYQARPMLKNQKQSENAFEIYRPGYRTLKFVAIDAKEMKEWIDTILEMVKYDSEKVQEKLRLSNEQMRDSCLEVELNERYQDVGPANSDFCKNDGDQITMKSSSSETPPPLPMRTTRKLPKVPDETLEIKNTCDENYDEDDIYHKIEDFSKERYQNCMVVQKVKELNKNYDDVQTKPGKVVPVDMYDDINSIMPYPVENGCVSYDEIKSLEQKKEKVKKSETKKLQHKRSFLDRVRRRTQKSVIDVVKIEISSEEKREMEEQPLYLVPPKPRPVCSLPAINNEGLYDDIDNCKKAIKDEDERLKNNFKTNSLENTINSQELKLDKDEHLEHYHVPNVEHPAVEEELYDDIALYTDFKVQYKIQRRQSTHSEKRVWSRFGSGKIKIFDFASSAESTKTETSEPEEQSEHVATKVTSFKRLINKMESSLGKSPIKMQANGVT